MNQRNDLVWTASINSITNQYEPMRTARRNTIKPNSFDDRADCEAECDRRNSKFEKTTPLILIPDRTPLINPLT